MKYAVVLILAYLGCSAGAAGGVHTSLAAILLLFWMESHHIQVETIETLKRTSKIQRQHIEQLQKENKELTQ